MIPFAPAGVMELVDVLDSKSSAARRAGSSPATGTSEKSTGFDKKPADLILYAVCTVPYSIAYALSHEARQLIALFISI